MVTVFETQKRNKKIWNKKVYLFGVVNDVLELPDKRTFVIGFDTYDKYGKNYGNMYVIGSGCAMESRLVSGFLEHTAWLQIEAGEIASIDEMRDGLIGETVGIKVKFTKHSPEIVDVICVLNLEEEGFLLNGLNLVPRDKKSKKYKNFITFLRQSSQNTQATGRVPNHCHEISTSHSDTHT